MIEEKILSYENNKQVFKSRKIDVSTFLRMKDFALIKAKPHFLHLVVGCRIRKLMTSMPDFFKRFYPILFQYSNTILENSDPTILSKY